MCTYVKFCLTALILLRINSTALVIIMVTTCLQNKEISGKVTKNFPKNCISQFFIITHLVLNANYFMLFITEFCLPVPIKIVRSVENFQKIVTELCDCSSVVSDNVPPVHICLLTGVSYH